jgi:hypothetical protein
MNTDQSRHVPLRNLAITVLVGTLAACSSGSNSFLANDPTDNLVVTRGTVRSLDTVTVNGRAFSTADASVFLDDQPATKDALRSGMQVVVQSQNGTASGIYYDDDVKGPVDNVDISGNISVMGQTIVISSDTRFDNSSPDTLMAGDIVEVSGIRDIDGYVHAAYIEHKRTVPNAYKVIGSVTQLNAADKTFVIGQLVIDYSNARFDDFSINSLSNGMYIEIKDENRIYEPGSFFLAATKIEHYQDVVALSQTAAASGGFSQRTELEIEALVTEIISDELFRIGSVAVRILPTTRFRDGDRQQLQVNSRIEVEGWLNADGELEAWEIEFDDESSYYDSTDEYTGASSGDSRDDDGEDDSGAQIELEGTVTSMDSSNGTLMVDGIQVRVGSRTEFENHQDIYITRSQFFSMIEIGRTVVKVKWENFSNYTDAPHQVEIEI